MQDISKQDICDILVDYAGMGDAGDLDAGGELVVDSLVVLELQHGLEERFGIVVDPDYQEIQGFTSLQRILEYVRGAAPSSS